jgi:4a-hydroxytetrahydrobiopterin dehydratase
MIIPKDWKKEKSFLTRTFVFKNFIQAIDFVNHVAQFAEKLNHHPDIEIFSYKKVKIKLTTHDKGSIITNKDMQLARKINTIKESSLTS